MKDLKRICSRLLYPPLWLIILLAAISPVALAAVFMMGLDEAYVSYAIYVISFYTLTVICTAFISVFPGYFKNIKQKVYNNRFGNRYLTDPAFKTRFNLYLSLAINLLYASFNLFSGIYYGTAWFMLFAAYYFLMAVMRFLLLRHLNRNEIGKNHFKELMRARMCAFILMAVNLSLSGAVLMMIYFERGFEYYGILIYVMAMYTFYITTSAIAGVIKYRTYNSPVMSMASSINLVSSLFSVLSLETAMLSQFGGDTPPKTQRMIIIATGAGISIVVICISLYTILKTKKEIKRLKIKESKNNGKQ